MVLISKQKSGELREVFGQLRCPNNAESANIIFGEDTWSASTSRSCSSGARESHDPRNTLLRHLGSFFNLFLREPRTSARFGVFHSPLEGFLEGIFMMVDVLRLYHSTKGNFAKFYSGLLTGTLT